MRRYYSLWLWFKKESTFPGVCSFLSQVLYSSHTCEQQCRTLRYTAIPLMMRVAIIRSTGDIYLSTISWRGGSITVRHRVAPIAPQFPVAYSFPARVLLRRYYLLQSRTNLSSLDEGFFMWSSKFYQMLSLNRIACPCNSSF